MFKRWLLPLILSLAGCGFGMANANVPPYPTYDPSLPFPIPASCPQTNYLPTNALTTAQRSATPTWMGSPALAAGHVDGSVWHSGENKVVWRAVEQPSLEINLLEGKSPPATVIWHRMSADLHTSTVTIPKTGCWRIVAMTPHHNLHIIVYVYAARYLP